VDAEKLEARPNEIDESTTTSQWVFELEKKARFPRGPAIFMKLFESSIVKSVDGHVGIPEFKVHAVDRPLVCADGVVVHCAVARSMSHHHALSLPFSFVSFQNRHRDRVLSVLGRVTIHHQCVAAELSHVH
jgi:hypothetical protein